MCYLSNDATYRNLVVDPGKDAGVSVNSGHFVDERIQRCILATALTCISMTGTECVSNEPTTLAQAHRRTELFKSDRFITDCVSLPLVFLLCKAGLGTTARCRLRHART